MRVPRSWLPWALGLGTCLALIGPALDPAVQIFYRDTFRCAYHFKAFIWEQLHSGRSPFWDPWTEGGTSVLVQITPGIFHPLNVLYVLPLELAFKLNHLLTVPLAFVGMYLLARKLAASQWGAAAGAIGYAGSGYLLSVVSSNLHYALGAATAPLALHAFFRFADSPRPLRLLWASFALATCMLGGEPQSMLLTGAIGAYWIIGSRRDLRSIGLSAAWGSCALLLAAPAIGPVIYRMQHGTRAGGITRGDLAAFANTPPRLAGLLLPGAFDDLQETVSGKEVHPYAEYFPGSQEDAFIDSIVLGAPILLLAFASKRRWLLFGALIFALGSAGESLPVQRLLLYAIPGLGLFRYAEKLIAPASLLLCLAAAFGADVDRKRLLRIATIAAVALGAAWIALKLAPLEPWLQRHGRTHSQLPARMFVSALSSGLLLEIAFTVLLAVVCLSSRSELIPLVCAVAVLVQGRDRIATAPLEVLHAPLLLGEELIAKAGPSIGRWRMRGDSPLVQLFKGLDQRLARTVAGAQSLEPMFHWLAGIESVTEYNSLGDRDYYAALSSAPDAFNRLMGVRFDVREPFTMSAEEAAARGYRQAAFGEWVAEFPERPRAFLAICTKSGNAIERMKYEPETMVVSRDLALPCKGEPGTMQLLRAQASEMTARTAAPQNQLLVISEHYDPGWSATIDGAKAEVLQVDLAAMGVVVPQGQHEVTLRFFPQYLWLSIFACGLCATALLLLELLQRHDFIGPRSRAPADG